MMHGTLVVYNHFKTKKSQKNISKTNLANILIFSCFRSLHHTKFMQSMVFFFIFRDASVCFLKKEIEKTDLDKLFTPRAKVGIYQKIKEKSKALYRQVFKKVELSFIILIFFLINHIFHVFLKESLSF